ncbi:Peroxisome biogenesis factor 10 [Portunus trituberculatus]|uniref:RING-type E3 ubiquitin transferase n=1 Tax=Portunus trituberculatus TaxID=210409 RepID=A0A5B7HQN3_PORTR|nr:Peroxisome biogenesis factor 10 [Portunus trituberculatus]
MPFQVAGAAEVLRATQKDENFLDYLKSCISEIVQRTAGTRVWLDIHKNAEVICELVYYGLTTLCVRQTLGEEYTGILQVDSSRRKLPSLLLLHIPLYLSASTATGNYGGAAVLRARDY